MAGVNETGKKTCIATEALEAYRRVKFTAGSGTNVEYADAGEAHDGVTLGAQSTVGGVIEVALTTKPGTVKVEAADSFAAGANLYGAADGKVSDTASGSKIGKAAAAASGSGSIVEMHPMARSAGGLALAQMGFAGLKLAVFDGNNGAGAITATGLAVGDRVIGVIRIGTVTGNLTSAADGVQSQPDDRFETAVTVADQLQQSSASDLSDQRFLGIFAPAAA